MRYVGFDIETYKITPKETNPKDFRPLGISCAALSFPDATEPVLFYESYPGAPTPEPMSEKSCKQLVQSLHNVVDNGMTIVTWNGAQFDFDILAEESGMTGDCVDLCFGHIDMMFHLFRVKGFPLGLQVASTGLGLGEKTEGVSGALAPELWAGSPEDRDNVLTYVGNDAILTRRVAERALEWGGIKWLSKKGRPAQFALGKHGWLNVREALHLPDPDQSWMSNPLRVDQFLGWTVPYGGRYGYQPRKDYAGKDVAKEIG